MVQNVMHTLYLENLSRVKEFLLPLCTLTSYGDSRVQKKVSHSLSQFSSICFHSIEVSDHVWSAILGYFICRLSIRPLLVSIFFRQIGSCLYLNYHFIIFKEWFLVPRVIFFLSLSTLRIRFVTYSPIHVKNDANDVTWDTSGVIIITQNINNVEM